MSEKLTAEQLEQAAEAWLGFQAAEVKALIAKKIEAARRQALAEAAAKVRALQRHNEHDNVILRHAAAAIESLAQGQVRTDL